MKLLVSMPACPALRQWGLTALMTVVTLGGSVLVPTVWAEGPPPVGHVALADLPKEAQITERAIRSGGPHPYQKDGTVFGNRERVLPAQPRGFYREYTVKTPGPHGRGARRIVCGGYEARSPEACFYSDDHYASFRRIKS